MDEIDKKLHDLLLEQATSYYFEGSSVEWFEEECPDIIRNIKKAFSDAGYTNGSFERTMKKIEVLADPAASGLMTGQEWYARFEKEMGDAAKVCTGCSCDAVEAAKRAAGISE